MELFCLFPLFHRGLGLYHFILSFALTGFFFFFWLFYLKIILGVSILISFFVMFIGVFTAFYGS
jgi:hypothetical protein